MHHGGEIYDKKVVLDFSVSLNPVPCPKEVYLALRKAEGELSRYPDQKQTALRKAVSHAENRQSKGAYSIAPENILCGNGSSELLPALIRMIDPSHVLLPVPSFPGYLHALLMQKNIEIEEYRMEKRKGFLPGAELLERITERTELLILANPNNPTGRCVDKDLLRRILKRCRETGTYLIVDECFGRLSDKALTLRGEIESYDRLFVLDSYTKLFSIPGVRIGFLFSDCRNIEAVKKFLPEWNLPAHAVYAGIASAKLLFNDRFLKKSLHEIKKEASFLKHGLRSLGLTVFPSDTNFLLLKSRLPLYEPLLSRGILIRDCCSFTGLQEGYYRIAVKDHRANRRLLLELRRLMLQFSGRCPLNCNR